MAPVAMAMEPAARKMDVDENYDDDDESDLKKGIPSSGVTPAKRESPRVERDGNAESKRETD